MHMVIEFLIPRMEHLDNAGKCPEIFGVGSQFEECFRTTPVKEPIQEFLIAVEQGIQFMRKGEDHMKIGRINNLRPAFIDPDFFEDSLTAGTVAVPAGIIVDFQMAAVRTAADTVPEFSGLTVQDRTGSFALDI